MVEFVFLACLGINTSFSVTSPPGSTIVREYFFTYISNSLLPLFLKAAKAVLFFHFCKEKKMPKSGERR